MCAIYAIVESAEVNENLLTKLQLTVDAALSNADDYTTGSILDHNLAIDIARDVVACDATLDLHTVGDAHCVVHYILQLCTVLCLKISNRNDIGLLKLVVAERCHLASRVGPVLIHT